MVLLSYHYLAARHSTLLLGSNDKRGLAGVKGLLDPLPYYGVGRFCLTYRSYNLQATADLSMSYCPRFSSLALPAAWDARAFSLVGS